MNCVHCIQHTALCFTSNSIIVFPDIAVNIFIQS